MLNVQNFSYKIGAKTVNLYNLLVELFAKFYLLRILKLNNLQALEIYKQYNNVDIQLFSNQLQFASLSKTDEPINKQITHFC